MQRNVAADLDGLPALGPDLFYDFLAVDGDVDGGLDAHTNLVPLDPNDGHYDVGPDDDAFSCLAGQD
jgi:hypothetical protein